jgi:hypothetical protein
MTKKYILIYLDILGFSNLVKKYKAEKMAEILCQVKNIACSTDKFEVKSFEPEDSPDENLINKAHPSPIKATCFSDSIVLSSDMSSATHQIFPGMILVTLYEIIGFLIKNKILDEPIIVRGAISIGTDLYHKSDIVVGQTLIDAHSLEENASIYPRIIIKKDDLDTYGIDTKRYFIKDEDDDCYYFDFLSGGPFFSRGTPDFQEDQDIFMTLLPNFISKMKTDYKDNEQVYNKYNWFEKYLNKHIKNQPTNEKIFSR